MKKEPKFIVKAIFNDTSQAKPYDYISDMEIPPKINDFCVVENTFANFNLAFVKVCSVVPFDKKLIKEGVKYKFIKLVIPEKSLS